MAVDRGDAQLNPHRAGMIGDGREWHKLCAPRPQIDLVHARISKIDDPSLVWEGFRGDEVTMEVA